MLKLIDLMENVKSSLYRQQINISMKLLELFPIPMCMLLITINNDIRTGADLGFSEGGAKPSSGSLKQGVWGAAPQKL